MTNVHWTGAKLGENSEAESCFQVTPLQHVDFKLL